MKYIPILLITVISCQSIPTWMIGYSPRNSQEYLEPDPITGCSTLRGRKRQQCNNKYSEIVEGAYNITTETILKSTRDGSYVTTTRRICFGKVCKLRTNTDYDPIWLVIAGKYTVIAVLAYYGGFIAGVSRVLSSTSFLF